MWAAFGAFVVLLLALDLFVLHRDAHEIETREAAVLTAVWVSISLAFGGLLWWWQGGTVAAQYLAGYVVEWSLSLDNVFVFALIFSYFAVPKELRYRVLFWGVVLAIVLRGVFIVVGASLLEMFAWIAGHTPRTGGSGKLPSPSRSVWPRRSGRRSSAASPAATWTRSLPSWSSTLHLPPR